MQIHSQLARLSPAPTYGFWRHAYGKLVYWHYRIFLRAKHARPVLEQVDGTPILVFPGVLNPKLMRSGEFFARQLGNDTIATDAEVLDMGTGSGICAVFAAKSARHVVAADINPAAVRCAKVNVLLNNLSHVDVVQSDLFAGLEGRRFDVILFNPPFVRGVPKDDADRAWRSVDVAERFASELQSHLTPRGIALVLLSTYGDAPFFLEQFDRCRFRVDVFAEREYVNEKLTIYRLTQSEASPS